MLVGLLSLAASTPAVAQDAYPSRPVALVIPFPPGGLAATVGRTIAPQIEKALGKGKHKVKLCIPYSDGAVLDMLHREAQIDSTDYAVEGTIVEAVVDDKTYGRVSTYIMDNE